MKWIIENNKKVGRGLNSVHRVVIWMEADLNVSLMLIARKGQFKVTKYLEKSVISL